MQTEHLFVIEAAWDIRVKFCASKTGLTPSPPPPPTNPSPPPHTHGNNFPTDRSKAVPLLLFFFVCASVVSYVALVLSLFEPHLFFFWCLGRAVLRDWGISWISSHICFVLLSVITKTCLYKIDPLKPHFYIVKLGFTGVYIIFLISSQKHILWVLVINASARRF